MLKENSGKLILLYDLIRVINILNVSLLVGMALSALGCNRYISLICMLASCVLLSYWSQHYFIKRYSQKHLIGRNKIFLAAVILFNGMMIFYYAMARDYWVLVILAVFILLSFIWMRRVNPRKKARERVFASINAQVLYPKGVDK